MRLTAERSRIAPVAWRAGPASEAARSSSAALLATVQSPAKDNISPSPPTWRLTVGATDTRNSEPRLPALYSGRLAAVEARSPTGEAPDTQRSGYKQSGYESATPGEGLQIACKASRIFGGTAESWAPECGALRVRAETRRPRSTGGQSGKELGLPRLAVPRVHRQEGIDRQGARPRFRVIGIFRRRGVWRSVAGRNDGRRDKGGRNRRQPSSRAVSSVCKPCGQAKAAALAEWLTDGAARRRSGAPDRDWEEKTGTNRAGIGDAGSRRSPFVKGKPVTGVLAGCRGEMVNEPRSTIVRSRQPADRLPIIRARISLVQRLPDLGARQVWPDVELFGRVDAADPRLDESDDVGRGRKRLQREAPGRGGPVPARRRQAWTVRTGFMTRPWLFSTPSNSRCPNAWQAEAKPALRGGVCSRDAAAKACRRPVCL